MTGKSIRDTLGFVGVVLSLLFVGAELRQNTTVARAQTRQALTDAYADFAMTMATEPAIQQEWSEQFIDDPSGAPSPASWMMWAMMRQLENVYLQFREDVIDESVFHSYGWTANPTYRQQGFQAWWTDVRERFHPDFVVAFEAANGI